MSAVLLLTNATGPSMQIVPALGLLDHNIRVAPLEAGALIDLPPTDVVLVDARGELLAARGLCRLLRTTGLTAPLIALVTEGGLVAVSPEWGLDDVVLDTAGPAELATRLRLAMARAETANAGTGGTEQGVIRRGELVIDETTYSVKLRGGALDLTFKEFELLKHLAGHPGRVYTRAQLLQEVWGYDYYGGTRTVDVHVRRLRAKLGPEHESLIGTVRHVGYKFVSQAVDPLPAAPAAGVSLAALPADGATLGPVESPVVVPAPARG
jgi:DNA-binding response OmpR family regulator